MRCARKATFGNLAVGARPLTCAEHRGPYYVDLCSRRCVHEGCVRAPSFGEVEDGAYACVCVYDV